MIKPLDDNSTGSPKCPSKVVIAKKKRINDAVVDMGYLAKFSGVAAGVWPVLLVRSDDDLVVRISAEERKRDTGLGAFELERGLKQLIDLGLLARRDGGLELLHPTA